MGIVGEKIKQCVSWVGNVFSKIISWFIEYMGGVNEKTEKFLDKKKEDILKCKDPKAVGQYVAGKHEANQIEKIAESFSKDLAPEDIEAAKNILESQTFDDE